MSSHWRHDTILMRHIRKYNVRKKSWIESLSLPKAKDHAALCPLYLFDQLYVCTYMYITLVMI